MARFLRYQKTRSPYVLNSTLGVRVRFDILAAEDMPAEVFAFKMKTVNPATGEAQGFFSHVCSPSDLSDFPAEEPEEGVSPAWFRLSYVDLQLRSDVEADDFAAIIEQQLDQLKCALDKLETVETVTVGTAGCEDDEAEEEEESSASLSEGLVSAVPTDLLSFGGDANWTDSSASSSGESSPLTQATLILTPADPAPAALILRGFDLSELPANAVVDEISILAVVAAERAGGSSSISANECSLVEPCSPRAALVRVQLYHPDLGPLASEFSEVDVLSSPVSLELTVDPPSELTVSDLLRHEFGVFFVADTKLCGGEMTLTVSDISVEVAYRA